MPERQSPIYTPPGGPPQGPRPSGAILEAIGVDGVFRLIEALYTQLEESSVRHLFPADMKLASRRSAAFFVQLLGGPPLFSQAHGPPRMRQRHLPFEIDAGAREVWLRCFNTVLDGAVEREEFPASSLAEFQGFLQSFSSWIVNVAPDNPAETD